jgi:hypothetical protein
MNENRDSDITRATANASSDPDRTETLVNAPWWPSR